MLTSRRFASNSVKVKWLSFIQEPRAFVFSTLKALVPLLLDVLFGGIMILGYNLNQNIVMNLILCIYCKSGKKCVQCLRKQAWLHPGYSCISESRGQFPEVKSLCITSKEVRGRGIISKSVHCFLSC